jgi:hypothetical protein
MAPSQDNSDHSSAAETDLWVFRDGRKPCATGALVSELHAVLDRVAEHHDPDLALDALIRAGELESALADLQSPSAAHFSNLTDTLANCVCGNELIPVNAAINLDAGLLPETVTISPPEGFSYYALQPLEFAELAIRAVPPNEPVAVIGIRSIGTTLSALVKAALCGRNGDVGRITVRPTGHPYDRQTRFDYRQISWIREQHPATKFLVVDEGPGRSGSTFLSVAEALLAAGLSEENIILLGSREPDASTLCASAAASRWSRFRFMAVSNRYPRFDGCTYIGGGEWRRVFLPPGSELPASWLQMERLKFLSADGKCFYKFEGLGRIGDTVRDRAKHIASADFGCYGDHAGGGFSYYPVLPGSPLQAQSLNREILDRIAQYCAFRVAEFQAQNLQQDSLADMLRFNLQQEFQTEFEPDTELLTCRKPVFVDGRMQPWEWIESSNILKTDAASHGDDHFFPGPTDIAWDLAGASVEWGMSKDAIDCLLSTFHTLSGMEVRPRFPYFLLAYTVVRMAYSKMAISTVSGTPEEPRILRDYERYRALSASQLRTLTGMPALQTLSKAS